MHLDLVFQPIEHSVAKWITRGFWYPRPNFKTIVELSGNETRRVGEGKGVDIYLKLSTTNPAYPIPREVCVEGKGSGASGTKLAPVSRTQAMELWFIDKGSTG